MELSTTLFEDMFGIPASVGMSVTFEGDNYRVLIIENRRVELTCE